MLMSLSERRDAPQCLTCGDRRDVPVPAIIATAACLLLVVVLCYYFPNDIFIYAASAGGVSAMFGWIIIGITHLAFRYKERDKAEPHGYRLPFTTVVAIAIILVAISGTFFSSKQCVGMLASLFLLLLYMGIYAYLNSIKKFTQV